MNTATSSSGIFAAHRKRIAQSIGLMLLTLLAGSALLGVAGHFLVATALVGASGALGFNFFAPSAAIRALTFVRILSRYAEKLASHDATLRIAADLRVHTFAKLLPLAPLELGKRRSGDVLNRLLADIEHVDGLLVRALNPLFAIGMLGLLACLVVMLLDVASGCTLLALLIAAFVLPILIDRFAAPLELRAAQAREALRTQMLDAFDGATDLLALQAQARFLHRLDATSEQLERLNLQLRHRLALAGAGHAALLALGLPLVLWLLFRATEAAQLSTPAAGGLWFMTLAVLEAAAGFAPAWQALKQARVSQQRLDELETPDSSSPHGRGTDGQKQDGEPRRNATLELHDVTFRWDENSRDLLHNAHLRIEPGQRIALHGDSGTGKSSLFALLLGLREPDTGSIRFGGRDLREIDLAHWHEHIAWSPQEAPVFSGSVRENLLLGAPTACDEQLHEALVKVQMDAAINAIGGLDALVGPNGATLSAGQSRRLALARALLRDAPILLLDEPTEGLDADTADVLMRDFATASTGRSLLVITHGELPLGVVDAHYRLADSVLTPA
ncbi:MAG: thiol reductant ABC exporter subunit CydC [Pseudoxanthomonas sp.]